MFIMRVLSTLLPFLLGSFVSGQSSIVDLVVADETLSTLETAVLTAGLAGAVTNVTVFAPVDTAFAALDQALLTKYLTPPWVAHLRFLLSMHLVDGTVLSTDLSDGLQALPLLAATTGMADPLTFAVSDAGVFVSGLAFNGSQVIEADIMATDGVVHKVDQVFIPEILTESLYQAISKNGLFETLISLLDATGLDAVFENETITAFGPPDVVFGSLPEGSLAGLNITEILLNHVVVGEPLPSDLLLAAGSFTTAAGNTYNVSVVNGTVLIGDIPVLSADAAASNGVAHVIGGILLPPPPAPVDMPGLVDLVVADEELSTLEIAVVTSGLVGALSSGDAFTVFAPVDSAFAAVDQTLLAKYLTPPWVAHLRFLLFNHLVDGMVLSTALSDGLVVDSRLSTITGSDPLMFTVSNETVANETGVSLSGLAFNDSKVIAADIGAAESVIHKVDQVLIPQVLLESLFQGISMNENFMSLVALLESTGLDGAVDSEMMTVFAPPDNILGGLPDGALDGYNVTEVLLNHVVIGEPLPSTMLATGMNFTTAAGNTYSLSMMNDSPFIGDIPVLAVDIAGSNGLAHVIGGVLLPPAPTPAPVEMTPAPVEPTPAPVEITPAPILSPTMAPVAAPTMPPDSAASGLACGRIFVISAVVMLVAPLSMILL